jgi:hypothetical protein
MGGNDGRWVVKIFLAFSGHGVGNVGGVVVQRITGCMHEQFWLFSRWIGGVLEP